MKSATGESPMYLELRRSSFHAVRGDERVTGALSRTPEGRLTEESCRQFADTMRRLRPVDGRAHTFPCHCAIPGTGVLLHDARLPAASRDETARLLRLRVESEFPLGPDDLAWGYTSGPVAADGSREIRIAAVRKAVLAEYLELLRPLELAPVISVAALARMELLPAGTTTGALLDVGPMDSELVVVEAGHAVSIRGFSRGSANEDGFDWSAALRREGLQGTLWVAGRTGPPGDASAAPTAPGVHWQELPFDSPDGGTATLAGLQRMTRAGARNAVLPLNGDPGPVVGAATAGWPWLWMGIAAVLLVGLLVAPYVEAWWRGPGLARRVAQVKEETKTLSLIDREFGFLRHLEASQPPYVDALYLIASAAPPGLRIESTSMNRRGEVALRGKTQTMAHIGDLRTKLMTSGFFSSVVVEDQSVGQGGPVQFRLSARWKSPEERESLSLGPELPATNKPPGPKSNSPAITR